MIERDGLLYSTEGAAFVAMKIAQVAKPFLGQCSPHDHMQEPDEWKLKTVPVQLEPSGVETAPTERSSNMPPPQPQWPAPGTPPLQLPQVPIPKYQVPNMILRDSTP